MKGFLEALPFYLDQITPISGLRQGLGWGSGWGCLDAFAYFCANCGKRENSKMSETHFLSPRGEKNVPTPLFLTS